MPTYQYACTTPDCGNAFELVQSFTDPAASECPVCGGPVRKVFSSVGVVFKGSGFYRNDSRSDSRTARPTRPATQAAKSSETSTAASTSASDRPPVIVLVDLERRLDRRRQRLELGAEGGRLVRRPSTSSSTTTRASA